MDDYRVIQRMLNEKGFRVGAVDGRWGPKSRSALRDFQALAGLSPTDVPDKATLKALGFQKTAQQKDESKEKKFSAEGAKSGSTRKKKIDPQEEGVSMEGGNVSTGATSTEMTFRQIKSGKTEIRNIACKIEATLKCAGIVNGRKATCESSKLSQSEIKEMGFAAVLLLPLAGPSLVAACFDK